MTTITKEQLIKLLQHRISVAAKYPDIEEAQIDATVFKIALASVEATPIYQVDYGNVWRDVERVQYDDHAVRGSPARIVYTAMPAPVVLNEAQSRELFEKWCPVNIERNKWHTDQYAHLPARQQWNAWNACRAAMLQAEPVSPAYKLPAAPRPEAKR
ncbi:hypothetical protein NMD88_03665 [Edwardsiella tarda]|uniref:hypothetical protein n=1 Tax=Edwardsiella tarda TaxID=636 RepID=UPI00351C3298